MKKGENLQTLLSNCEYLASVYYLRRFHLSSRMFWTLELADTMNEAPWPATKDELIDFAIRSGAPTEVVENLQELETDEDNYLYESMEEIWPDMPTNDDFLFNADEY